MTRTEDRAVPWLQVWGVLAPGAAILAVFGLIALQPSLVETLFTRGLGRVAERVLGTLTGWLPFSVAEWIEGALIAWLILAPLLALIQVVRRRRSFINVAQHGLARLLVLTLLALIGFYASWGLNYARAPLIERMGWRPPDPAAPLANTELILLADDLVDAANRLYLEIHGVDDAGAITAAPQRKDLDRHVELGWARAVAALGWDAGLAARRPQAKPLLASPITTRLGLSGFYFPYTAEANYNAQTPGWQLPHTIAHEKAHQRSFASEDEANFGGFVACLYSDDPTVRYAGTLFAQRQILFALIRAGEPTAGTLVERRLPGVQRDVTEARAFWRQHEGLARDLSHEVNNAYLTANGVRGGINSYSLSTELIVAWAGSRGLSLDPGEP